MEERIEIMEKRIAGIIVFVLCINSMVAQNFATLQMEYMAGLIKCPLPTNSSTFHCSTISSLPLKIEYDKEGVVCHLGLSLFSDSLKKHSLSKPLYDFQERLFLEVFLQEDESHARKLMNEYKVQWTDYSQLFGASSFFKSLESSLSLASKENVEYLLTKDSLSWTSSWMDDNGSFVLRFPANYDLISSMDKKEAEIAFSKQLQTFQCNGIYSPNVKDNIGELQQLNRSNYVLRGNELFVKAMNGNIYFQILYDRNFPEESIVNLFNYPDQQRTKGLDLQIQQIVYGGDSLSYHIKLSDFQCFIGDDYDVFTGIEKCNQTVAEFSIIYKSKWYNHYHLLYVKTNPDNLFDRKEALKAVFYTFIPNHNIKNLYKEYVERK